MSPTCSISSRRATRRQRNQRGTALVEFAFIFLLLVTLLFGIMGFSQAVYCYHFVNNAAKTATRWAAVNGSTCADDGSCNGAGGMNNGTASAAAIQTYVGTLIPDGIDSAKVTTTATWPSTNGACLTNAKSPGCIVQVTVSYPYTFVFPLMPSTPTTAPCTQAGICFSSTSKMIIAH
jgi:Flp pilus assembly protein TadG